MRLRKQYLGSKRRKGVTPETTVHARRYYNPKHERVVCFDCNMQHDLKLDGRKVRLPARRGIRCAIHKARREQRRGGHR